MRNEEKKTTQRNISGYHSARSIFFDCLTTKGMKTMKKLSNISFQLLLYKYTY